MSKTQRCVRCTDAGIPNELWADEVCIACGLCSEHCPGNHVLSFHHRALTIDGKRHPDAGKVVKLEKFTAAPLDADRPDAELPFQPSTNR